jgi:hypothetical protein
MSTERPIPFDDFRRTHFRTEERVLIQSTCKTCGKSQLVSSTDGSLQKWESNHDCKEAATGGQDTPPEA